MALYEKAMYGEEKVVKTDFLFWCHISPVLIAVLMSIVTLCVPLMAGFDYSKINNVTYIIVIVIVYFNCV